MLPPINLLSFLHQLISKQSFIDRFNDIFLPINLQSFLYQKATKHFASGSSNESADTPYDPVGGPQVPQEAHGKHLFVPGAGSVGEIIMTHGYKHRP